MCVCVCWYDCVEGIILCWYVWMYMQMCVGVCVGVYVWHVCGVCVYVCTCGMCVGCVRVWHVWRACGCQYIGCNDRLDSNTVSHKQEIIYNPQRSIPSSFLSLPSPRVVLDSRAPLDQQDTLEDGGCLE